MVQVTDMPLVDLIPENTFDALSALAGVYAGADTAMSAFGSASGVACPSGCGRCCESFVPDMLPLEAEWMAIWLIRNDPSRAEGLAKSGFSAAERSALSCPFFHSPGLSHCGIYEGRALVCRLFGFAATRSRNGEPIFAFCRHMPVPRGVSKRSWKGEEIGTGLGAEPPLMSDLAAQLLAIRPEEGRERRSLVEALPAALQRIYLIAGLRSQAFAVADRRDARASGTHGS